MAADSSKRNLLEVVMYGYKHLHKGGLNENGNLVKRETRHAWLQTFCMKAILTTMIILTNETNHAWLHNFP